MDIDFLRQCETSVEKTLELLKDPDSELLSVVSKSKMRTDEIGGICRVLSVNTSNLKVLEIRYMGALEIQKEYLKKLISMLES